MVYTSTSLALASIEYFVHLDPSVAPEDLSAISATLPLDERDVEHAEVSTLPEDWRAVDNVKLQGMGEEWIRSGRSVALAVPSVAVEGEWNLLLNPAHADFLKIAVDAPRAFHFDRRMFR